MIYDTDKQITRIDKELSHTLNDLQFQLQTERYDLAIATSHIVLHLTQALSNLLCFSSDDEAPKEWEE